MAGKTDIIQIELSKNNGSAVCVRQQRRIFYRFFFIWRAASTGRAGKYLYDENRTLKGIEIYNAENVSRLNKVVEYIIKVLNVAGMQNGFSHNEVFLTQEGKPLLVESNPRHCGQPSSTLYKIVYGTHRMHTLLDALENKSLLGNEAIYRTGAHACALHLYNFSCDKPAFINTYGVDSEITVLSFRGANVNDYLPSSI